jgi:hypothetical protein
MAADYEAHPALSSIAAALSVILRCSMFFSARFPMVPEKMQQGPCNL